jgi:hypothetical protein
MTGIVHTINRRRGLVAIHTDRRFTIVELLGSGPISLGDRMQWDHDGLDSSVYFNQMQASRIAVNVQAYGVSESRVTQRLKL